MIRNIILVATISLVSCSVDAEKEVKTAEKSELKSMVIKTEKAKNVSDIVAKTKEVKTIEENEKPSRIPDEKVKEEPTKDTLEKEKTKEVVNQKINTHTVSEKIKKDKAILVEDTLPMERTITKEEADLESALIVGVNAKIQHIQWDDLLQKHVDNKGQVNYKAFLLDKVKLEKYLATLSKQAPKQDWTKQEKLAYWINAYNAFTVKLILDNYPLKSIMDINKAWDKKFIVIENKTYSLGEIENNILRKMHEPRIHFAINCASVSCPNLLNEAFVAEKLEQQLRKVTSSFLKDTSKNILTTNPIKISKLFEWYKTDFSNGDIIAFLNKYGGLNLPQTTQIEYLEYNWNLNGK